jgi:hypothetical protein
MAAGRGNPDATLSGASVRSRRRAFPRAVSGVCPARRAKCLALKNTRHRTCVRSDRTDVRWTDRTDTAPPLRGGCPVSDLKTKKAGT